MEFKAVSVRGRFWPAAVLIESDWNLKIFQRGSQSMSVTVLIESDWNLKDFGALLIVYSATRINRIRLEFKVCASNSPYNSNGVLIESDWNLKMV